MVFYISFIGMVNIALGFWLGRRWLRGAVPEEVVLADVDAEVSASRVDRVLAAVKAVPSSLLRVIPRRKATAVH